MNINDYSYSKKEVQESFLKQKNVDIVYSYTLISVSIHVPTIVCAFFVGEITDWPKELLDNIEVLIKTYGYTNLLGIPDSYPGRKV